MGKKQRGLLSSVILVSLIIHVVIGVVFTLIKVAQALIEPEPDFVAVTPPTLETKQKEKKVEVTKRQRQSGGSPPKVVITSNVSSSFEVPQVDVKVSSPEGKLGGRGDGKGFGDGIGQGTGRGLGKSFGIGSLTNFGAPDGPGLKGYFYDLKLTKGRKPSAIGTNGVLYHEALKEFLADWDPGKLDKFYRARNPLYTPHIYVPLGPSEEAAKAFGEARNSSGFHWIVHYKGRVSAPENGSFRFIGLGDNIMVVRLNGKVVLDWGFGGNLYNFHPGLNTSNNLGPAGPSGWALAGGTWFKVTSGETLDLEIMMGDGGGLFCDYLMIEKQGQTYPQRRDAPGHPAYPLFQVSSVPLPKEAGRDANPGIAKDSIVFPLVDN